MSDNRSSNFNGTTTRKKMTLSNHNQVNFSIGIISYYKINLLRVQSFLKTFCRKTTYLKIYSVMKLGSKNTNHKAFGTSTLYSLLRNVRKLRKTFPMRSTLSMEERKRLPWIQIPRDCRAPWSIFSSMFGLSSSITWIKLSSSLSTHCLLIINF